MNTAKLYRLITENRGAIREDVYSALFEIVNEEIAKEAEKKAGRKANVRNAVKKFLGDDSRPILKRANVVDIDGVTYYGYCDGFKLAWSPIDFGFGVNTPEESLKFTNVINIKYRGEKGTIKADAEFKKNLNIAIKTAEDRYKIPFDLVCANGNIIRVNAKYLQACLDFTEADEIIVDMDSEVNPIVMYGKENRNALCLPIRR